MPNQNKIYTYTPSTYTVAPITSNTVTSTTTGWWMSPDIPQLSPLYFSEYVIKSHPTGSSYICEPPVLNTDFDTIILAEAGYIGALLSEGWTPCSGAEYSDSGANFYAYRKGTQNYIVTTDTKFYKKFVYATKIAKSMNLLNKEDRVKLFDAVLYKV